jgi:hypothetical protein
MFLYTFETANPETLNTPIVERPGYGYHRWTVQAHNLTDAWDRIRSHVPAHIVLVKVSDDDAVYRSGMFVSTVSSAQ